MCVKINSIIKATNPNFNKHVRINSTPPQSILAQRFLDLKKKSGTYHVDNWPGIQCGSGTKHTHSPSKPSTQTYSQSKQS